MRAWAALSVPLIALLLAACVAAGPAEAPTALPSPTAETPTALPSPTAETPTALPSLTAETPTRLPSLTAETPAALTPASATPTPTPTRGPGQTTFDPALGRLTAAPVGEGFRHPLYVTHAGDGSGRIYVAEKVGRVRLLDGRVLLDISDKVRSPELGPYEQEQGFLGLAFHPRFAANGYVYAHYIDLGGGHVISRFTARADGQIDRASEKVLLTLSQPDVTFNGGQLLFGPDGYLYIGLGVGGNTPDQHLLAQNLGSLFGKILRVDVDRGDPYGIPADNPFVGRPGARPEVWAAGLRNPYRFSFDRASGDLWVGGPGQLRREWVHHLPAPVRGGENFGWPILEGSLCWIRDPCSRAGLLLPVLEYDHTAGNCVVIGGYVYRGERAPALRGAYLYGDFCSGRIWAAARAPGGGFTSTEVLRLPGMISSFGEDEAGELYVTDIRGGVVYRLEAGPRLG